MDVFEVVTTSRAVAVGYGLKTVSITGYSLGWIRVSLLGHDMCALSPR
jgi:hypothetical protein